MKTLESISKLVGTHFVFACDPRRGHVAEYMVMPSETDDYWITSIINIHPDSLMVGVITKFKSDDAFMQDEIVLTREKTACTTD